MHVEYMVFASLVYSQYVKAAMEFEAFDNVFLLLFVCHEEKNSSQLDKIIAYLKLLVVSFLSQN